MSLVDQYRRARRGEVIERVRRLIALRAMAATGSSQHEIATALGVSQSAINQQLHSTAAMDTMTGADLLEAAAPILEALAREAGYRRMAVFGSLARGEGREASDLDLIVDPPAGASSFEFVRFKVLLESVVGREVDLISYGALRAGLDADIVRDLRLLKTMFKTPTL